MLRNADFTACDLQQIVYVITYEKENLELAAVRCWNFELKFVWPPLRTASAKRLKTDDQNEE